MPNRKAQHVLVQLLFAYLLFDIPAPDTLTITLLGALQHSSPGPAQSLLILPKDT